MTDHRPGIEALLARLEPPSPPGTLRERALRRADAALHRPVENGPWERIYASRILRAAWAVAVVGLVVAHLLVPKSAGRSREIWFLEEAARRIPELRQVVAVPRLREAYVSVDAAAYRRAAVTLPVSPRPDGKEKSL